MAEQAERSAHARGDGPRHGPGGGRRLRICGHQTVETKRIRLRSMLAAAASSADGLARVEAVAAAAEEAQRQELEFDEHLMPALQFLAAMGHAPAAVFRSLDQQLRESLIDSLRNAERDAVERALADMLPHVAHTQVRELVVDALQRLSSMPPQSRLECSALAKLAAAMEGNPAEVERLPVALRRRIWERRPELFLEQVRPLVAQAVHALRRRGGTLFLEVLNKPLEQRLQKDPAVEKLLALIGGECGLYKLVLEHLMSLWRDTLHGRELLRLPSSEGAHSGHEGVPTSLGAEVFVSSLRSQMLMEFIDNRVIRESVAGTWLVTAESSGQTQKYRIVLRQHGATVSGTSQLEGIDAVEGTLQGSKLVFKQVGSRGVFTCTCDVSQGWTRLSGGRWHFEAPGRHDSSVNSVKGVFLGSRIGPVLYTDSAGNTWDEATALVHALDMMSQKKGGAQEAAFCTRLQEVARSFEASFTTANGTADPVALQESFNLVMADPIVMHQLIRCLLVTKPDQFGSVTLLPEARIAMNFLLYVMGSFPSPEQPPRGSTAASSAAGAGPTPIGLGEAAPTVAALAQAGIRCDALAAGMRRHYSPESVKKCGADINTEIGNALQHAQEASRAAHMAMRLVLNALTIRCLRCRNVAALESCLDLVMQNAGDAPNADAGPDWIVMLLVDSIVGVCQSLGDRFDVNLRRVVTGCLFRYAEKNAWVHERTADLLTMYARPNFASSREEITSLQRMLRSGCFQDSHFDYHPLLASHYQSWARTKAYLVDIYRSSKLAWQFPMEGQGPKSNCTASTSAIHPDTMLDVSQQQELDQDQVQHVLAAEDGVMIPGIGKRVREFLLACDKGDIADLTDKHALQVTDLLVRGYRGHHWLCHLVASFVTSLLSNGGSTQSLLRGLVRRKLCTVFDAHQADQMLSQAAMPAWLYQFIEVPEWRTAVYDLASQGRGQASSFLSAVLLQISESQGHEEELRSNASSMSNFIVFSKVLRAELACFFKLLNKEASCVAHAINQFCHMCSFSEYTYVYSQAVLHQLMRARPRWRAALRHLSQSLTDAASKKASSVVRLDLRFTFFGQYTQIFGILYSMCRFGLEVRVAPSDVVRLHGLVDGLLKHHGPQCLQGGIGPARGDAVPLAAALRGSAAADADTRQQHLSNEWGGDGATEAGSVAGSWLDDLEPLRNEDEVAIVDSEQFNSRSSRDVVPEVQKPLARGEKKSEETPSIFYMPAVSSVCSGGRAQRSKLSSVGNALGTGTEGVVEALRRPAILDALVSNFVDPSMSFDARELTGFTRLLATVCTNGVWTPARRENETAAAGAPATAAAAMSRIAAKAEELEKVYRIVRHPQLPWQQRVVLMSRLQRSSISSVAGLRWLVHVVLSQKLSPRERLARMSESGLPYLMLKRAVDAHPRQARSVVGVIAHILEVLPSAADVEEDGRSTALQHHPDTQRSRAYRFVTTTLLYLIAKHDCEVPVLDFVERTASTWDVDALRFLIDELLAIFQPPYSERFAWACARVLMRPEALAVLCRVPKSREAVLRFCKACNELLACNELFTLVAPVPSNTAGRGAARDNADRFLEERGAELRSALAAVEAHFSSTAAATEAAAKTGNSSTSWPASEANVNRTLGAGAGGGSDSGRRSAAAGSTGAKSALAGAALTNGSGVSAVATDDKAGAESGAGSAVAVELVDEQAQLWDWWSSSKRRTTANKLASTDPGAELFARAHKRTLDQAAGPASRQKRARGSSSEGPERGAARQKRGRATNLAGADRSARVKGNAPPAKFRKSAKFTRRYADSDEGSSSSPRSSSPEALFQGQGEDSASEEGGAKGGPPPPDTAALPARQKSIESFQNSGAAANKVAAAPAARFLAPAPAKRRERRLILTSNRPAALSGPLAEGPNVGALQGRWMHSCGRLLTVQGVVVLFDGGLRCEIAVQPSGALVVAGYEVDLEASTADKIHWVDVDRMGMSCFWQRASGSPRSPPDNCASSMVQPLTSPAVSVPTPPTRRLSMRQPPLQLQSPLLQPSPLPAQPQPPAATELSVASLQGRWRHSIPSLGMLDVSGNWVVFDSGSRFPLNVHAGGSLEVAGYYASREGSSDVRIAWVTLDAVPQSCCWHRD